MMVLLILIAWCAVSLATGAAWAVICHHARQVDRVASRWQAAHEKTFASLQHVA